MNTFLIFMNKKKSLMSRNLRILSKNSILKYSLLIILLIFNFNVIGQNFELKKVLSDHYYYNCIKKNNNLYLSSNNGIYILETNKQEIELFNKNIRNAINENLTEIKYSDLTFDTTYKKLIPVSSRTSNIISETFENKLYIISKGVVFIFEPTIYDFHSNFSVRSISENYLGTYGGIFKNGIRIEDPSYTNGHIREIDNKTYICFDGLITINEINNEFIKYQSVENYEFKIGTNTYGKIHDITKISTDLFLIFTDKGLYRWNVKTNSIELIYKNNFRKIEFIGKVNDKIFFFDQFNICEYDCIKNYLKQDYKFDEPVSKIIFTQKKEDINSVYVLHDNNEVFFYNLNYIDNSLVLKKLLYNNKNKRYHSLGLLNNYLFLISDVGVDLYNLTSHKIVENVIQDEMNKLAQFNKNDTLLLGGVLGTYLITKSYLNNYIDFHTNSSLIEKKNSLNYLSIIIIITIVMIAIVIFFVQKRKKRNQVVINKSEEIEKNIKEYIENNIAIVSIQNILDKFNISNTELYKIMKEKPGTYIRNVRLQKLNTLLSQNIPIEEISELTGFSISYLKKIR